MALAAVVVLVAVTKSIAVAEQDIAAPTCGTDQLNFGFLRYTNSTIEVIAALAPEIANGLASTSFISSPPMLHNAAVRARSSIALDLSLDKDAVLTIYPPHPQNIKTISMLL
jgi:hypothetical protein